MNITSRNYFPFIGLPALLFFAGLSLPAVRAQIIDFEEASSGPVPIYRLQDHLARAKWKIIKKENQAAASGEAGGEEEIQIVSKEVLGEEQKGILFHPVEGGIRRLQFENVPPGSKMVFYYGFEPEGKPEKSGQLSVRIWAGKHLVEKFYLSPEKGWKKREIDLGIPGFLNCPFPLTFDLAVDKAPAGRFLFDAEIFEG